MAKSLDYRTLSGPQKAAVFMLAVGREHSSKIFERMDDEEIRELSHAMSTLGSVNAGVVERLFVEFADQLSTAYERETDAQQKRIETEQARSTADEQPRLVEAQIAVQVANQREQERAALGRAERQYLEELARGQRAQVDVLGQDRVALLQALEKLLTSLERKPELVGLVGKLVPNTVVGGDSGFAGAAALLGASLGGAQGQQPSAGNRSPVQ